MDLSRHLAETDGLLMRVMVAEDGSTDGTQAVLTALSLRFPELIVHSDVTRKGRGKALRDLWSGSDYDAVAYIDTDLAMGTEPLVRCLREIRAGADLAVGSRYALESTVNRPPLVGFVSRAYNWLIRGIFDDGVLDHQCGLKALSARARDMILPVTSNDSWFWDTELIIRCHQNGLVVREIPLDWVERKNPRTSVRRLLTEVFTFSAAIVGFDDALRSVPTSHPHPAGMVDGRPGPRSSLNANR
jgi:glycosyltransferase involved in cell wall biosynthesis